MLLSCSLWLFQAGGAMLDPQEDRLSDMPDYNDLDDEAFPPLPPPYSPGQGGGQEQGELFGGGEAAVQIFS